MNVLIARGTLLAVCVVSLTVASCQSSSPNPPTSSSQTWDIAAPTSRPADVLHGLQSLRRVQIKLPEDMLDVRDEVVRRFRDQLPQLDVEGSDDDWTLEFVPGSEYIQWPPVSVQSERSPRTRVRTVGIRLFKMTVLDGRSAMAVAYEGQAYQSKPYVVGQDREPLFDAIAGFAKAWRQANPSTSIIEFKVQSAWAHGRLNISILSEDAGLQVVWLLPDKITEPCTATLSAGRMPWVGLFRGHEAQYLRPTGSPRPPTDEETAVAGRLVCTPKEGKNVAITLLDIQFPSGRIEKIGPLDVQLDAPAPP